MAGRPMSRGSGNARTGRPLFALFLAALLVGCGALFPPPARASGLSFAPLPMETPDAVVATWKPLLAYLESRLDTTIRIEYTASYDELLERFIAGRIDIASLGPLPYVELKKRFPAAQPVVFFKEKDGRAIYTCTLYSPIEAGVTLNNLRGKKVALTQPLSTCGYLAVDGLLRKAGNTLENNRYRYLGSHDAVLQAVAAGRFDAGGAKTSIGEKYLPLGLAVVGETPHFPGMALVANGQRVSTSRIELLRRLLMEAPPQERGRWGEPIRHGVVVADDRDYAALRALLPPRPIPERGNF